MHAQSSRGFTLIELLMVVAVIAIISAIAVPGLLRSRIAGNEAAAIGSLKTLIAAQQDYSAFHHAYATDLAHLSVPCPGSPVPFLSADLDANGVLKSGYFFEIGAGDEAVAGPTDCNENETQTTYYASSVPDTAFNGRRAFATNSMSAIWQNVNGEAPAEPFTRSDTVSPLGH